jgi:hypothetical protein
MIAQTFPKYWTYFHCGVGGGSCLYEKLFKIKYGEGEVRCNSTTLDLGTRYTRSAVYFTPLLHNPPGERVPSTYWIGDWVGPCGEEKISCTAGNRTPTAQPVARR